MTVPACGFQQCSMRVPCALVLGWEWEITKNAHAQQPQLGGRGVLSGLGLRNNKTTSTDQLQSGGGGVLHPSILPDFI